MTMTVEPADDGTVVLNFGPQHPATHGTLRNILHLDGETIVKVEPEIGFLHTGFEKLGEHLNWQQYVTVTDRMNYFSPISNNIAWALSVEKLMGIEVTKRCAAYRVLLAEQSRISDHILSVGLQAMDLGAFSVFLYAFEERERFYDLWEMASGARFTPSITRIGGMMREIPDGFLDATAKVLDGIPNTLAEIETLLDRNRIFQKRTVGVGRLSRADAVSYGVTGPLLRASGEAYDVRRAFPYLNYDQYDFDVPTHAEGDVFARYRQRMLEIRESIKICRQVIASMPGGEMNVNDPRVTLPKKEDVYHKMESMIAHFKLLMEGHGIRPPAGEAYVPTEAPNGEMGFYVGSDGTDKPCRVRVRPPSFINYASFPKMVEGKLIADAVSCLGSLNVIAGELDR